MKFRIWMVGVFALFSGIAYASDLSSDEFENLQFQPATASHPPKVMYCGKWYFVINRDFSQMRPVSDPDAKRIKTPSNIREQLAQQVRDSQSQQLRRARTQGAPAPGSAVRSASRGESEDGCCTIV